MSWYIDPAHTQVEFSVKHMMIATVRGRFAKFSGEILVSDQDLLKSSVVGSVEAASIDTHDANRDAHLRSADFFDAETYPVLSFRSTAIQKVSGERYQVTGQLTIKDVTREVVFDVSDEGRGKDPWGNLHWGFSASTSINRKDFGLNWNVALEAGGWLVGDTVKISADVELVFKPEAEPEKVAA